MLAGCSERVIRRIASVADEILLAPGDVFAEQGRAPQWFLLVCSGTAEVTRDEVLVGLLGAGEYSGEVPLLARGFHPTTVRAITPLRGFVIGSQAFIPLVEDVRSLGAELCRALERQADLVEASVAESDKRRRAEHGGGRSTAAPAGPEPALGIRRVSRARPRTRQGDLSAPRRSTGRLRACAGAAIVTAVVAGILAGCLYHPPFAVVRPGAVVDISSDVAITGAPVHPPRGRYLLLTVRAERRDLFGLAKAALAGDGHVVRVQAARRSSAARAREEVVAEFADSQRHAVAAAAGALGMTPSSRASLRVTFRRRDIVGPSAGLIYALAIDDMLSATDRVHGRVIAATGEIGADGVVDAVSFVHDKASAAQRAGAQLFLAPVSQADQAAGIHLPVIGVSSLAEAVERLERS